MKQNRLLITTLCAVFVLVLLTGCLGSGKTIEGEAKIAPGEYHEETIEIKRSVRFGLEDVQQLSYEVKTPNEARFDVFVFPANGSTYDEYRRAAASDTPARIDLYPYSEASVVGATRSASFPAQRISWGTYHVVIDNTDVKSEHGGANATDEPINVTYRITAD